MSRSVEYFGAFNKLLNMWWLNQPTSSPQPSRARRLFNSLYRLFFKLAPYVAFSILTTSASKTEEPFKFLSKHSVPFVLLILNFINISSLNSKFEQLNALINLAPAVSSKRVKAQLQW